MIILVTGSNGLVGSALQRISANYPYKFIFLERKDCFLEKEEDVRSVLYNYKPNCIINCAALVGGIKMNKERPGELFYQNTIMNTLMIEYARRIGVKRLFMFSSACAFPEQYPLVEDEIQDGKPFINNFAYGYAKRMVDIQISAYQQQYGTEYCSLIPTSIYGENDNFSLENGHFIPSLIHKAFLAKQKNEPLVVWGDGSPLRELIYAEDLAKVIMMLLEKPFQHNKYLISSGQEVSVKQMAEKIAEFVGLKGIIFQKDKPNGQHRKPANIARLKSVIGDFAFTPYETGLKNTISWFTKNRLALRV